MNVPDTLTEKVQDRVEAARRRLENHGEVADALVSAEISASWNRCLAAGLDPMRPPRLDGVDPVAWNRTRGQHEPVSRVARREMAALHEQIAGSNFLIAFAHPDGTVLDALVDGSFRRPAQDRALGPGMCWSEMLRGTNALGLSAALRRPTVVHGSEHFFRGDGDLTCVAAPVWGPDGELAGVLDASSSCSTRQLHTSARLTMAAAQIENALFREAHRERLLIAFHGREEFLYTSGAGLIAMDGDGQLLGASPQAMLMLHGLPVTPGARFGSVFDGRFATLVAPHRNGDTFRLRDRSGSGFFATVIACPSRASSLAPSLATPSAGRPAQRAASASAGTRPAGAPAPERTGYVARDAAVARSVTRAAAAARRGLPILIGGETGTGKEELARSAHRASGRPGRFVAVNCAALPGELVEAELFGHVEGAFTGARRGGAPGLVAEADGGTLFLDEIGDMDHRAQGALLRLLDDWTLRPIGGGPARKVDVLLVAATNVALDTAVADGRFRRDLLHRLAVVTLQLPRLAERQDFDVLARAVAASIDPALNLTAAALAMLARQPWTGNIRELRNVLTRATLDGAATLTPAALAPFLPEAAPSEAGTTPERCSARATAISRCGTSLDRQMAQAVAETRRACNGSISETARRLGVSRNRVYRALRQNDQEMSHA